MTFQLEDNRHLAAVKRDARDGDCAFLACLQSLYENLEGITDSGTRSAIVGIATPNVRWNLSRRNPNRSIQQKVVDLQTEQGLTAVDYHILVPAIVCATLLLSGTATPQHGSTGGASENAQVDIAAGNTARCIAVELFVLQDCPFSLKARTDLEQRPGLQVRVLNVSTDKAALKRLYKLAEQHKVTPRLPMVYACGQVLIGYDQSTSPGARYDSLFTIDAYTRQGCAHCAAAKSFLRRIEGRYPGFKFAIHDVANSADQTQFEKLNRDHGIRVPGVPTIRIGGEVLVGYFGDSTSGAKLQQVLEAATVPCAARPQPQGTSGSRTSNTAVEHGLRIRDLGIVFRPSQLIAAEEPQPPPSSSPVPPLSEPQDASSLPPPNPDAEHESTSTAGSSNAEDEAVEVDVPVLGRLNARRLGMPLFTILIGLVDGFNPCAMWVLLFMLSILIGMHDRRKILAVAGTFVVVSGVVYFAFMAAWLNAFHFIGLRRWSEIALALIATVIGAINIKDFFAFKQGITLSIPESARPGIYARMRKIATAENLPAAIAGAAVLAVLINFVELLCTAGLPALYTKVLTMQRYSIWGEYGYLVLYILAYVFDDSIMVGIAVVTLGRHKLQERGGRWLKLIGGIAILAMGLVLLFAPQWLT